MAPPSAADFSEFKILSTAPTISAFFMSSFRGFVISESFRVFNLDILLNLAPAGRRVVFDFSSCFLVSGPEPKKILCYNFTNFIFFLTHKPEITVVIAPFVGTYACTSSSSSSIVVTF